MASPDWVPTWWCRWRIGTEWPSGLSKESPWVPRPSWRQSLTMAGRSSCQSHSPKRKWARDVRWCHPSERSKSNTTRIAKRQRTPGCLERSKKGYRTETKTSLDSELERRGRGRTHPRCILESSKFPIRLMCQKLTSFPDGMLYYCGSAPNSFLTWFNPALC